MRDPPAKTFHIKLNRVSRNTLAPVMAMHILVTDASTDPETIEAIHAYGPRVIVAAHP